MVNSAQKLTLYVDGACKGNPGIGGWGALIIDDNLQKKELYNGELETTNNRMELTAAIEGILACPLESHLVIYTDSSYVQKGITEWIVGWKAKNWKNVKNPDLWQKLDTTVQGREIEWHWIKGHAGHEGNERADQLANLGAELMSKKKINDPTLNHEISNQTNDWLLDDPFGFDEDTEASSESIDMDHEISQPEQLSAINVDEIKIPPEIEKFIKITPTTNPQIGERQLILDTETTGFYYQDSDRIIEVGAIEMINRKLTGSSIHIYINPKKPVGESENIHGISDDFLADKPLFEQISQVLYNYLKGSEIVAHNATFDMNFLNMEFERAKLGKLSNVCTVTDTLLLAKSKHPGQKNSLDALVKRYEIPARDRTFHGALLDAEILSDVYLAMTGGQVSLDIDHNTKSFETTQDVGNSNNQFIDVPLILPSSSEIDAHQNWVDKYNAKNDAPCLFDQIHKT